MIRRLAAIPFALLTCALLWGVMAARPVTAAAPSGCFLCSSPTPTVSSNPSQFPSFFPTPTPTPSGTPNQIVIVPSGTPVSSLPPTSTPITFATPTPTPVSFNPGAGLQGEAPQLPQVVTTLASEPDTAALGITPTPHPGQDPIVDIFLIALGSCSGLAAASILLSRKLH